MRLAWVAVAFAALVGLLAVGLRHDPREVPSPLIGKPAPRFVLPRLHEQDKTFSPQQQLGKVWLLNVWASWCVSCREEHPVLVEFSKTGALPVIGFDYKDSREDAKAWLARYGDPYELSAFDADGRAGIDLGVYGVPETYLIDKRGIIRYKRIGPVTPKVLSDTILPLAHELERQ